MELKEILLKRRSVRKFLNTPVSEEQIEELLHAAMSGPSACNKKPWEFYVVRDPDAMEILKRASRYTNYNAPMAIVICGNENKMLPEPLKGYWIDDCSAAAENILLRAVDLGLGTVWCGGYPQPRPVVKVREALNLGEEMIPLCILFVGYPAEEPPAGDQYDASAVHYI